VVDKVDKVDGDAMQGLRKLQFLGFRFGNAPGTIHRKNQRLAAPLEISSHDWLPTTIVVISIISIEQY
jgi:hypothetical protein